ncbi:hypothetical protein RhiirA1_543390 [Rhizophagus irregularis]|uniref:Crinkler effector protein N-terminal domain-containing protein n=1 Tax=Rhizophagus irregularis TaxID=588596 RepID=A0A2N0QP28_9GLOM|nr:hypothetical protein RhiirA1_543390 [Rhizophagus irregularis]
MSSTTSNIHLVCFVRGETGKDIFPVVINNNSTVENLEVKIRKKVLEKDPENTGF